MSGLELFAAVVYLMMAVGMLAAMVAVPVALAVAAARAARDIFGRRRPVSQERARAEAELREQYASGVLTLVGLEERLEDTLRARSHLELAHVLDDLPARPRSVSIPALAEVVLALAILLVSHSWVGRATGVVLGIGAVLPPSRLRPAVYTFLAGVALLAAPLAAVPAGLAAAWRWREERL